MRPDALLLGRSANHLRICAERAPRKRWAVEQTFGWLGRYRRTSKHHERSRRATWLALRQAPFQRQF
jgi:transposase